MPQCVVIADDLTGANATGVLFKKMNYNAYTVTNADLIEPETLEGCECVLYPTDSRAVAPQEAYDRVKTVCDLLKNDETKVYANRIDSTLRGNLGPETDAMLDSLGEDYVAVVAPAFPSSGRVVIGGYMLVNGVPLHKTNIAVDPKTPVKVSEMAVLFKEQSRYQVSSIFMNDLMDGVDHLAEKMKECVASGSRILCIDCVDQEDLDLIADATIATGLKAVAVDPGVFTATLSERLITKAEEKKADSRMLVVVGSVNGNTKAQMETLWSTHKTNKVMVKTQELLEGDKRREAEIARVTAAVLNEPDKSLLPTVTGDGLYEENRIDFGPYMERDNCSLDDETDKINSAFAEIAHRVFASDSSFKGIYTSGGDITVAVCRRFQTAGLCLMDEVLPLAAYGQFLKGDFEGVNIITKGGSQGGPDAINRCVDYLSERI